MKVAVLGAGTMGSGIAQLVAMHGIDASMYDLEPAVLTKALVSIDKSLARFTVKGVLSSEQAETARQRIQPTSDLAAAVDSTAIIVEAVPEDLALKRRVFADAVVHGPADALLATNTSQLSITAIGADLGDNAARLIGTHFFNPPVLMRLVEVVRGDATSDRTVARARAFAESLDKDVVVIEKDSPGFITTRVSAIVRLECLRMLEEGVASAEDIDKACRLGLNFPMGPIELGDFNGLDTYLKALESLEVAHGSRFRPTSSLREMVAAGRLGRKTGHGFYKYDGSGRRVDVGIDGDGNQ